MHTLHDLLVHEMEDLYDAEHRILKVLPKMIKKVTSPDLAQAFADHLEQTQEHVRRLDEGFELLGARAKRKKCDGIIGLLKEGEHALTEPMAEDVRDAAIIGAAQRVEHYEMAGYGCARTYAHRLGEQQVAHILQKTLDEEGETDQLLTRIAESSVNEEAMVEEEVREVVNV